jgi:dTDP-4-dehydrorhamnose 3,5-epimerase
MTQKSSHISGLSIEPLKQIEDERGAVLHMLRADSPLFSKFGEIYFSLVNPGIIKAWNRHRAMSQHLAVPIGQICLVIYDDRAKSPSRDQVDEILVGRPRNYFLVRIPPMLWYGFQGIGETPSLVANCTDMPHDPFEMEKRDIDDAPIPYRWKQTSPEKA